MVMVENCEAETKSGMAGWLADFASIFKRLA